MKLLYPIYDQQAMSFNEVLLGLPAAYGGRTALTLPLNWVRFGVYQADTYIIDPVLLRLFSCDYLNAEQNVAVTDRTEAEHYALHATTSISALVQSALDDDEDIIIDDDDWDEDEEWLDEDFDDDDSSDDDEDFDDDDFDDEDFEDLEDEDWENDFEEGEDDVDDED